MTTPFSGLADPFAVFGPPAASPLAGLVRPAGSPPLIATMAQEQADLARGLHDGAQSLAADAVQARASWQGEAAEAFSAHVRDLETGLLRGAGVRGQAAAALAEWSAALRSAQDRYDEAEELASLAMTQEQVFAAERRRRAALPAPLPGSAAPAPLPPVVSPLRAAARDQAVAAIASAEAAASRCTSRLTALTPHAPAPVEKRDSGGWRSWVHGGLDAAGLIPFVGEPADLLNGAWYELEGDHVNAALSAAGAIPIAGWGATAAKGGRKGLKALEEAEHARSAAEAGSSASRALSAAERSTLDDALRTQKLDHIFVPKHKLDPLVHQFGSRQALMEAIVRSIGGPLPQAGPFQIAQSIGGRTVVIRGAVVDGILRIGTVFTP